jgi:hypothetical protein
MTTMESARLPREGPAMIGPVALSAGRLVIGNLGAAVAWATMDPVPESGRVWAALSELHPRTGLVPIQLDGLRIGTLNLAASRALARSDGLRPWDNGEFVTPEDPRGADRLDIATLLGEMWRGWVPAARDDDPELARTRAPFGLEFPGLAPPQPTSLAPAERQRTLDSVLPRMRAAHGATPAARIGLVAADRPADIPAVIGWGGLANRGESLLPLSAVFRSWEDRFGARLIDVGYAGLRLVVERPPRTLPAAQRIAAEHVVLADECLEGTRDIPALATRLVNAPVWTFWWD